MPTRVEIAKREAEYAQTTISWQTARIAELEEALRACVSLAAGHAGVYKETHQLPDLHPVHKDIINRAQRLLGGREL